MNTHLDKKGRLIIKIFIYGKHILIKKIFGINLIFLYIKF